MKIEEQHLSKNIRIQEQQFHITKGDIKISLIKFAPEFYNGIWKYCN